MATPPAATSHLLSALCFGMLMVLGLIYGVYESSKAGLGDYTPKAWLDGTAGKRLDTTLALPYREPVETADAALRYVALGQLGTQVQQGCPGWLFYTDGVRAPVADVRAEIGKRIALMKQLAGRLRAANVQVLAVTVPDKSRIAANALCGLTRPADTMMGMTMWQQALSDAGVPHVDLTQLLASMPDAFYRTDVHMNQTGAAAAAQAVARAALALLGQKGSLRYDVSRAPRAEPRVGDLLVLAGLGKAPDGWRPAPDSYVPETFTLPASGGLLDDGPPVEVLLAGSSNSRRSNFAEQLGQALGQPVWNQSRDGGKFADALVHTMQDRDRWPKSLRLVIWEMSEMSLLQPLTEQEKSLLQGG
ncbi:alginate O-acetyltransferase AlgX-related protein [Pandoraea commovens]|uniref:Cell division protein FtsQ n=1 Tax=Pandoraea commovens TaxID=2508289 RepID=A0ABY5QES1_9BURK|nr:cell division protein FtsQ [Pandoraea commovens]UVA79287.1 cell division protein FtsQ [Pandoraea commovens]